jgi:predicted RNase H-like HicB family nuclease
MKLMKYLVILEPTSTGYGAYVPDLPGCVSTGRTKQQVERNAKEAIEAHLYGLRREGQPIPEATSTAAFVSIDD